MSSKKKKKSSQKNRSADSRQTKIDSASVLMPEDAEEEYGGEEEYSEEYNGEEDSVQYDDAAEEYYAEEDEDGAEDESADGGYGGVEKRVPSADKPSDDDSLIPESLRPLVEKCRQLLERMDERLYRMYFKPDRSKLVSGKTAIITLAAAAAASLLIGFAIIIFVGTYPFHTTGMKTKDFIREFNNITSDTDIRTIVPSYTDVLIPDGAKLGREPVYFADGHVKLTAKTRFGKIIEVQVEGIDLPNYDDRNYSFLSEYSQDYDPSNKQFYYYIALGKTAIAAQKLIPNEELDKDTSDTDTSGSDSDNYDLTYVPTVYEAASYGYQLYYYSYYYYYNQLNSGYLYLPMGKSYLYYELSEERMTIKPVLEKITNLPEGLQKFWDGFTGKNKQVEEDQEDSAELASDIEQQPAEPVSPADTGTQAPKPAN